MCFILIQGYLANAQISCREVLGDPKRMEESQKIVLSALNTPGSQTWRLLNYMRLQVKKAQDAAIKILSESGVHLAESTETQKVSVLAGVVKLNEEFKMRSQNSPQGGTTKTMSLIPWGTKPKQLSLQELAQKLQKSSEELEKRKTEIEELSDKLFVKIAEAKAGIQLLENEIRFLKELNSWMLSLKDIENRSSIELHEFALGIEDQISIMDQQIEVIKEQTETMVKSVKLLGQESRDIEKYMSLDWPMTQNLIRRKVALIPKIHTASTVKKTNLVLSASDLAQPFRHFLSGDQIRLLKADWISMEAGKSFNAIFWLKDVIPGVFETQEDKKGAVKPLVLLSLEKNKLNWLKLQRTKEHFTKKYSIDINSEEKGYRVRHGLNSDYDVKGLDVYVLANPEMDIEGFKLDQIVEMTDVVQMDHIRQESDQFVLLGQILGTNLRRYDYPIYSKWENTVVVKLFFYEPKTRTVRGSYYAEVGQEKFKYAKPYEEFQSNEN